MEKTTDDVNWNRVEDVVVLHSLLDAKRVLGVGLSHECFDNPMHRGAWGRATAMAESRKPWTAADVLEPAEVSRLALLPRVSDGEIVLAARRLRQRRAHRACVQEARAALAEHSGGLDSDGLRHQLNQAIERLDRGETPKGEIFGEGMRRSGLQCRDNRFEKDGLVIPTPWPTINHLCNGGLPIGTLVLVGGVTSHRKTTVCRMMAVRAAQTGRKVVYWNLEDGHDELAARNLAHMAGRPHRLSDIHMRRYPHAGDADANRKFERAIDEAMKWQAWSYSRQGDTLGRTLADLRAVAAEKGQLDLIVVDYLQLLEADDSRTSDTQHFRLCANKLRALAKELKCCIVAAVQLKHDSDARIKGGGEPRTSDIYGGAAIAQSAYAVLMSQVVATESGGEEHRLYVRKWKGAGKPTVICDIRADQDVVEERPFRPRRGAN